HNEVQSEHRLRIDRPCRDLAQERLLWAGIDQCRYGCWKNVPDNRAFQARVPGGLSERAESHKFQCHFGKSFHEQRFLRAAQPNIAIQYRRHWWPEDYSDDAEAAVLKTRPKTGHE